MMLGGSFGLFFTLFLLFCRYLPMVAMAEVKAFHPSVLSHGHGHAEHHGEAATAPSPPTPGTERVSVVT